MFKKFQKWGNKRDSLAYSNIEKTVIMVNTLCLGIIIGVVVQGSSK